MDRSGLPKAVVWFLGNLPRPDLFDGTSLSITTFLIAHVALLGPRFQADDIMNVLSTVQMPTNMPPSMQTGVPAYGPRSNSGELNHHLLVSALTPFVRQDVGRETGADAERCLSCGVWGIDIFVTRCTMYIYRMNDCYYI